MEGLCRRKAMTFQSTIETLSEMSEAELDGVAGGRIRQDPVSEKPPVPPNPQYPHPPPTYLP
jgi:hypothetical protein